MKKTKLPHTYGGETTTIHIKHSLMPYLIPPATSGVIWAGVAGAHKLWIDSQGWAGAGIAVAGIGLTALTWRAAKPRGEVRRLVATCCAAGASVWVLGSTLAGPWERPWLDMWLAGTAVATAAFGILRVLRAVRGEDVDISQPAEAVRDGGLMDAVRSLKNATIGRTKVVGARAVAEVEMPPGDTIAELAADRDAIESALDVRPGAARVIPSPTSVRRGRLEVVPIDQLAVPPVWPGLSAPGESIAEPIVLGVAEDGEPVTIWLPGDVRAHRNAAHYLVVGMSGAGKTELLLTLAAEVISRPDAELWFADARKGPQLPDWLKTGAARIGMSEDDAHAMLEDLLADVTRRAKWLGQRGFKQWTPEVGRQGLPYRVVIIDEASSVAAGNKMIADLTEVCRSVGISLVFGLQRASYDRFPTSARANVGGSLCLGVESADDAAMALQESTMAAGARPWLWKAEQPGMVYAEVPGTDKARWPLPCRTFIVDENDRATAVVAFLRRDFVDAQEETEETKEMDALDKLVAYDAPDDVDPSKPIVPPAGARIELPLGRQLPPQQARDALVSHLYDLMDAGHDVVRPAELGDVLVATGMGSSWLRKALNELCAGDSPMLARTERGVYRLLVPEPV